MFNIFDFSFHIGGLKHTQKKYKNKHLNSGPLNKKYIFY